MGSRENLKITCEIRGMKGSSVSGEILTSTNMTDHNDFDTGEIVVPREFKGAKFRQGMLEVTLPAKSVVVLSIK